MADLPVSPLPEQAAARPPRWRRRLLWSAGVAALLLLLLFIPPLVNANRYRLKIAQSMSASLGRPVHLDNVTLHLLPVPGLTLSNFVVSENPAFGDEPTIRADDVEATLRLPSLWRRRVEFSTVRFLEPHVNLVRNREGHWNLADVLLHASHVDTAPTAQRHAGPAPRFPYIEATGGRVNVKLADEKLPFAITDADFALWLPSPSQWSLRLTGQPARTDRDVTDPGTVRLEGELQRAATVDQVPVDLRITWHDAPMGEASLLLTGEDLGWRGTLNLDSVLKGTLGDARVRTKLTLGGLHRSDFVPQPLDLQITCRAGLSVQVVTLSDVQCRMPDAAPSPLTLEAASLNLQHLGQADARLSAQGIPLHWALLWAALFSPRVPTDLHPAGTVDLSLEHLAAAPPLRPSPRSSPRTHGHGTHASADGTPGPPPAAADWSQWTGTIQVALPAVPGIATGAGSPPAAALPLQLLWRTVSGPESPAGAAGPALRLQPTPIRLGPESSVVVAASVTPAGYSVSVNGSGSPAALLLPARYLPQLGDGLNAILPFPPTGLTPARVSFACTRQWGGPQTCTSARPAPAGSRGNLLFLPGPLPAPAALSPRSLSPLDRSPALGGTPPGGGSPRP